MLHHRRRGWGLHWAFAAAASVVGTAAALLAPGASARFVPSLPRLGLAARLTLPEANAAAALAPAAPALPRLIGPVSAELRAKGFNDCFLPDPGPGAYLPYRPGPVGGRLFLPKDGGHTDDFGYDVLVHFHGAEPVRKTLVQVSEGLVYLGIDLGIASGPYEKAYENPQTFAVLRAGVEKALRVHAGDERAHVRHLGLSAWSAGYGAVNAVLRHHAASVDAVVLLDGLHAGFSAENKPRTSLDSLTAVHLAPTFAYAEDALRGEKIFFFSHSHVDPVDYASTARTGELLLAMLGLEKTNVPDAPSDYRFGLRAFVDRQGFHLRDYGGNNEHAHCAHTRFVEEPLVDILAPAWQTPRGAAAEEVALAAPPQAGDDARPEGLAARAPAGADAPHDAAGDAPTRPLLRKGPATEGRARTRTSGRRSPALKPAHEREPRGEEAPPKAARRERRPARTGSAARMSDGKRRAKAGATAAPSGRKAPREVPGRQRAAPGSPFRTCVSGGGPSDAPSGRPTDRLARARQQPA